MREENREFEAEERDNRGTGIIIGIVFLLFVVWWIMFAAWGLMRLQGLT